MATIVLGLLHLLDRDGTSLCSSPFGFVTGSLARCTCLACVDIWMEARGRHARADDAEEVEH